MLENQKEARGEAVLIVGEVAVWLWEAVERSWGRGQKHNPTIYSLVQILSQAVQLIEEDSYISVNEQIYQVLSLLKQPQNIEISDELVDLLHAVLRLEQNLSQPLL
jgi:hypothetical protein